MRLFLRQSDKTVEKCGFVISNYKKSKYPYSKISDRTSLSVPFGNEILNFWAIVGAI